MKALALAVAAALGMAGTVQEAQAKTYHFVYKEYSQTLVYDEYYIDEWYYWTSSLPIRYTVVLTFDLPGIESVSFSQATVPAISWSITDRGDPVSVDRNINLHGFKFTTTPTGRVASAEVNLGGIGIWNNSSETYRDYFAFSQYGEGRWYIDDPSAVPLPASALLLAAPLLAGAALSRRRAPSAGSSSAG